MSLTAFWFSFPKDPGFPFGMGVTARSKLDAFRLLEEKGYDFHLRAQEIVIREGVTALDFDANVRPNSGPIVVRGVWYPCLNIGFGAPGGR